MIGEPTERARLLLPSPLEWALAQGRGRPPEGYRYAWHAEQNDGKRGSWRALETFPPPRCRWASTSKTSPRCENDAVAELLRSNVRASWWGYCAEHLYGRALADGTVYSLILEEASTDG
jgi:hypothetical protein